MECGVVVGWLATFSLVNGRRLGIGCRADRYRGSHRSHRARAATPVRAEITTDWTGRARGSWLAVSGPRDGDRSRITRTTQEIRKMLKMNVWLTGALMSSAMACMQEPVADEAPTGATTDGKGDGASDDPFDPDSCAGAPLSFDEALALFQPGESEASLGAAKVEGRFRACTPAGCGPWKRWGSETFGGPGAELKLRFSSEHEMSVVLQTQDSCSFDRRLDSLVCDSVGSPSLSCGAFVYHSPDCYTREPDFGSHPHWVGQVSHDCVRLSAKGQRVSPVGTYREELEAAVLVRLPESASVPD